MKMNLVSIFSTILVVVFGQISFTTVVLAVGPEPTVQIHNPNQVASAYTKVARNENTILDLHRFEVNSNENVELQTVYTKVGTNNLDTSWVFVRPTTLSLYRDDVLLATEQVTGYYVDFNINTVVQANVPAKFTIKGVYPAGTKLGLSQISVGSVKYQWFDGTYTAWPVGQTAIWGGEQYLVEKESIESVKLLDPNGFDLPVETVEVVTVHSAYIPYTVYTLEYSTDLISWKRLSAGDPMLVKPCRLMYGSDPDATPRVVYFVKKDGAVGFFRLAPFLPTPLNLAFTKNLSEGDVGPEVENLRVYLEQKGYLSSTPFDASRRSFTPGVTTGLRNFQLANGISPATGVFGPLTRAFVIANP